MMAAAFLVMLGVVFFFFLNSSKDKLKVKFDLRWAVVAMAARWKHLSDFRSLTGEKLDLCLLCSEMTALEFAVEFITSLIRLQLWNFNMHYYMQYPTHITTHQIHLLVFSHAQRADRMELKIGVNGRESSVCAHWGKARFFVFFFDIPASLDRCVLNVGFDSLCNQRHDILAGYVQ